MPKKSLQVTGYRLQDIYDRLKKSVHSTKGFTLIEILATISIIALIGATAVPAYRRYNEEQFLNNESSQLLQMLRQSQSNAQSFVRCSNNNPAQSWSVVLNTGNKTYTMQATCIDSSGNTTTETRNTKSLQTLTMTTDCSPTTLIFERNKISQTCSITITNPKYSLNRKIFIDKGGSIYEEGH